MNQNPTGKIHRNKNMKDKQKRGKARDKFIKKREKVHGNCDV